MYAKKRKSSLHVTVDSVMKERLQAVANRMSIPISHFTSMVLADAINQHEQKYGISQEKRGTDVACAPQ